MTRPVAPLSFPTAEDALAWYDSERANLVAATRQASVARPARHRLAAARSVVRDFQQQRQPSRIWLVTHRIALDSARRVG